MGVAEVSGSADFFVDFVDFELGDSLLDSVFVALSDFLEVGSSPFFFSRSDSAFICEVPDISLGGLSVLEVEVLADAFGEETEGAVGSGWAASAAVVAAVALGNGFTVALTAGVTDAAALGMAVTAAVACAVGDGLAVGAAVALAVLWVCALAGAMARPTMAKDAPNKMDFFIRLLRVTESAPALFSYALFGSLPRAALDAKVMAALIHSDLFPGPNSKRRPATYSSS